MSYMRRRSLGGPGAVALFASLALLLTACGGGSTAKGGGNQAKEIRVELFCSGTAPLAAELAMNSGLAEQQGLKVTKMCVTSGSAGTQALIGGSADVFMGDIGHVMLAQAKGLKLRAYAVANDRFSYVLVARNDKSLNSVADLKGKKVAITAPGTLSDTELQKATLDAGLDYSKDLTVINGGAGATMQAALNGGQVAAGMVSQPDTLLLLKTGQFHILWQEPDYNYVDIVAMANSSWVEKNRPTLQAFLTAMEQASMKAKADPATATTWMKKQGYAVSDGDLAVIVQEGLKSIPDGLRASPQVAQSSADLLVKTGFLEQPIPKLEAVYDYSLLPGK